MQQSGIQQRFHQGPNAADGNELRHEVLAAGFQIRQDGHAFADAGKVIHAEFDFAGVGNGQEMQDRVG